MSINEILASPWIYAILFLVVALFLFGYYASRFEKAGPNEVLIVSGRIGTYVSPDGSEIHKNFRIYHGGGTFVWPVRERHDRLSLELMTLEIRTPEFFTKFGVPIIVDGIAQIKVRSDDSIALITAAEMFLSKSRREMNEIALQMMSGHLRAVISTMPFEEIHTSPESFAQTVQRLTAEDLANMGIQVISFTIREIQDPSGYLRAIGRPKMADVQKNAVVGEANAHRDASMGEALAQREATVTSAKATEESELAKITADVSVAEAAKDKDIKLHAYAAEVASAKADSDIAYQLQRAKMDQLLADEKMGVTLVEKRKQVELEESEIERRQMELMHMVRKPAEAESERMHILAEAEQHRAKTVAAAEADAARVIGLAEADIIRAKGEAEAESIRLKNLAEAEGMRARLLAEAEGMQEKAKAWQQYNEAAISQMLIERLPEIAAAVSAPLGRIDKITMLNSGGDSTGVGKVTQGVADVITQIPMVVEALSGIDLKQMVGKAAMNGKAVMPEAK
jgi:flotillin